MNQNLYVLALRAVRALEGIHEELKDNSPSSDGQQGVPSDRGDSDNPAVSEANASSDVPEPPSTESVGG